MAPLLALLLVPPGTLALPLPIDLLTEFLSSPARGIDTPQPRFSWTLVSDVRGVTSVGYQIVVEKYVGASPQVVWDSGKISSNGTVQVEYMGSALVSDTTYAWRVRWTDGSSWSAWSDDAQFDVGLLSPADWQNATWLTCASEPGRFIRPEPSHPCPDSTPTGIPYPDHCTWYQDADGHRHFVVNCQDAGSADSHCDPHTQAPCWAATAAAITRTLDVDIAEFRAMSRGNNFTCDLLPPPCNFVRREIRLPAGKVVRSRAYFTSMGWSELRINGRKASESVVLEPGWTQWERRMLYSVYDVTTLLRAGEVNAIGVALGKGWPGHLGHKPTAKLLLSVEMDDGVHIKFASNPSEEGKVTWRGSSGPLSSNDIYAGEVYSAVDAERTAGWDKPGFNDSAWLCAISYNDPLLNVTELSAQPMPAIRAFELLKAADAFQPAGAPNDWVLDFNQNIAGWTRLELGGCPRGTNITVRYAEVLCGRGPTTWSKACFPAETVDQRDLHGTWKDTYICRGGGKEVYEPKFTYHGFRFAQISGLPPSLSAFVRAGSAVRARVVHSDVYFPTNLQGRTSASTPGKIIFEGPGAALLNQVQHNIQWTQRDNLFSLPTDCDQRNERQGWMADASVSSEEAINNFWMAPLYSNWLRTMSDVQKSVLRDGDCDPKSPTYPDCEGTVADTVPHPPGTFGKRPADPSWGFAYPLIFENVVRYYGDERLLRDYYPGIKAYVDWEIRAARKDPFNLLKFHYYGDWLEPGRVPSEEGVSQMSAAFNYLQSLRIARDAANALGLTSDASHYQTVLEQGFAAYHNYFFNNQTRTYGPHEGGTCELQPALVYPLYLGMVSNKSLDEELFSKLVYDIRVTKKMHVSTGIIATKWLFELLSRRGENGLGLDLVLQTTFPSWGYMIAQNATTVWEHWEYMNGVGMNSHNHPAFASIGSWLYRHLAGLRLGAERVTCSAPEADFPGGGFGYVVVGPRVIEDPRITGVSAKVQSIHGLVSSKWHLGSSAKSQRRLTIEVDLPVGSKGEVRFPKFHEALATESEILEDGVIVFTKGAFVHDHAPTGVRNGCIAQEASGEQVVVILIGSGRYKFEAIVPAFPKSELFV